MKKRSVLLCVALSLFAFPLFSQNVGIGTAAPAEKLHVAGTIRSDALASPDTNVVISDVNGTLMNFDPGTTNQVLMSQGAGRSPRWGSLTGAGIIETYAVSATRTYVNTTTFTMVGGLSRTITLTGPGLVHISTYGSLETDTGPFFSGGSGCEVQTFLNGSAIANAIQTVDVNDASGIIQTIQFWSYNSYINLPAGTYTFDVRARMYNSLFDPFYAGGNFTGANPNEGALILTVFYQ